MKKKEKTDKEETGDGEKKKRGEGRINRKKEIFWREERGKKNREESREDLISGKESKMFLVFFSFFNNALNFKWALERKKGQEFPAKKEKKIILAIDYPVKGPNARY